MRGGNGEGVQGCNDEPRGDTDNHTQHTEHEHLRILLESHRIANLALNRARDTASHQEGTSELKDASNNHGVFH